jgi:hypothetical protein
VSVAATSTVAIAVPFISARLERRRLAHAAHQAQIDELRALLDECAVHLTEGLALLFDLNLEEITDQRREQARAALPGKVDQLVRDGIRLALRLGEKHDIKSKHDAAQMVLMTIESAQRRTPARLTYDELNEFSRELGAFIDACASVVGIDGVREAREPA